jgi:hypothetical protein
MTDDTENMSLMPLIVNGVAHGFAVDGKTFVFFSVGFVPTLQGSVEMHRIDPDQDITDDVLAWDKVIAVCVAASETLPGLLAKAFGPICDSSVSAHSTQASPRCNGQNRGESMPSALGSAGIGDFGEKGR